MGQISSNFQPFKPNSVYHSDYKAGLAKSKARIAEILSGNTSAYVKKSSDSEQSALEEIIKAGNMFVRTGSVAEQKVLADTLEAHNLELYCYDYTETSRDKSRVARMAFEGYVDRPNEHDLSLDFRRLKNLQIQRAQAKPEEYNLDNSTVWQVFKQVPEFAAIEDKLKSSLSSFGVPPAMLPSLSCSDICYLINEKFRSDHGDAAKVFPESYKARNTKRFIRENEAEFRAGMMAIPGVDKNYVETLIRAMHHGFTDITRYKENGRPAWRKGWENQPKINVHHIINVKDCSNLENSEGRSFAEVNRYKNMCFMLEEPVHTAAHALENDIAHNTSHNDIFYNRKIDRKFIFRIQPPQGVRCMLGFDNIIYDKAYLEKFKDKTVAQEAEKNSNPNYHKNYQTGKHDAWRKQEKHKGISYEDR